MSDFKELQSIVDDVSKRSRKIFDKGMAGVKRDMGTGMAILDMPSAAMGGFLQGGLRGAGEGMVKRYQGDTSSTLMDAVPQKLGLTGTPALAAGLVAEIGIPDPRDVAKIGKLGRVGGKASKEFMQAIARRQNLSDKLGKAVKAGNKGVVRDLIPLINEMDQTIFRDSSIPTLADDVAEALRMLRK